MTAIADALIRAGYESPRDRINNILHAAVEKHGGAKAAAVAEVGKQLAASDDAALLWEFFSADRNVRLWAEVERMFRQVRQERGLEQPAPPVKIQNNRKGQVAGAEQSAEASTPPDAAAGDGQETRARKGHAEPAAPAPQPSSTLIRIARNSLLRSIEIAGRPIGECTAGMAREWSRARGREARFAWLLAEGLPDSEIIGKWKTEADAEEAARLARETDNG